MKTILIILILFCTASCYPVYKVRIVQDDTIKPVVIDQNTCQHFFVSQTIPVDYGYFDSELGALIDEYRLIQGSPCACIYCGLTTTCY